MIAQGRSVAYEALGNLERATSFQEDAVRFAPGAPAPWRRLAKLYRLQGRVADEERAKQRATALAEKQNP